MKGMLLPLGIIFAIIVFSEIASFGLSLVTDFTHRGRVMHWWQQGYGWQFFPIDPDHTKEPLSVKLREAAEADSQVKQTLIESGQWYEK